MINIIQLLSGIFYTQGAHNQQGFVDGVAVGVEEFWMGALVCPEGIWGVGIIIGGGGLALRVNTQGDKAPEEIADRKECQDCKNYEID